MIKIGITGGIGSGKSYVAHLLQARGIPVYDSDTEAKRLMCTDGDIRRGLVSLLGEGVYLPGGGLDKQLVARYLFASPDHAARVNAIVHPRVKADFLRWAHARSDDEVVAIESAILLEAGFADAVDFIVTVYAPREVRMRRVMRRDGASPSQVDSRMASQMDDASKCDRADFVIVNDGIRALAPQLDDLQKTLEKMKKGNG